MRGLVRQPRDRNAHRIAAERLGRAGPRNVVALRLRRHSDHCGAGLCDERRGVGGHHLPDARTGLSRQAGPSAAPLDHLVRLARRGDRGRSAGRHRTGVLSRAHPQLTGQLHCVETGVGKAQRTRHIRADIQIHAPRRLHRLPPFGTHVHLHQRPFGADTLGLRRGTAGRLRGRMVRHSAGDDPRSRRLDRHGGPHGRSGRTAAGHPRRHSDLLPRRGPAQQRLFAQRHGGGRSRRDGRHERRGIRRHGQTPSRPAVAREYLRPRQSHGQQSPLRHSALHQRHGHHELVDTPQCHAGDARLRGDEPAGRKRAGRLRRSAGRTFRQRSRTDALQPLSRSRNHRAGPQPPHHGAHPARRAGGHRLLLPLRHRHHARAGSAPRHHPRRRSKLVPLAAFPADALDAHGRPHRTVQYRRRAGRSPRRGAGRRLLQDARRSVRRVAQAGGRGTRRS